MRAPSADVGAAARAAGIRDGLRPDGAQTTALRRAPHQRPSGRLCQVGATDDNQRLTNLSGRDNVSLQIRFFKIESIECERQAPDKVVAPHVVDRHAAWDPAGYGITQIRLQASSFDPETSDIWLPDITPLNALTGLMPRSPGSGTRHARRGRLLEPAGHPRVLCRFTGLASSSAPSRAPLRSAVG